MGMRLLVLAGVWLGLAFDMAGLVGHIDSLSHFLYFVFSNETEVS